MKRLILFLIFFQFIVLIAQNEMNDTISNVKELNEVEVKGKQPLVVQTGSVSKIRVKGTLLEKMGNIVTMLSNTPGLHRQGEKIVVNGSQEPVFVVDGREIKDMAILSTLPPDMIASVEIDVAPGLEHSDGLQPVVSITTVKSLNDYLYLSLGNFANMKRRFSDGVMANIRTQAGKFSSVLSYKGGFSNTLIPETYFRNIYHSDYCFTAVQPRELLNKYKGNTVRWNNDVYLNQHNRLGFEYDYNGGTDNDLEEGDDVSEFKDYTTAKHINRDTRSKKDTHSFTLEYNYKKGANSLLITQDFAFSATDADLTVNEQPAQQKDVFTNTDSDYKVYSSYINYTRTLPSDFILQVTSRLSVLSSHSTTTSNNKYLADGHYHQCNDGLEIYPRTYLTLRKYLGKYYYIAVGGRHQYVNRRFSFSEQDLLEATSRTYSHFVNPYLYFQYKNKNLTAYIEYTGNKTEPNLRKMNSGSIYQDSLTYIGSSTTLTGSEMKYITAGLTYGGAGLTLRYTHTKNPMTEVYTIPTPESNIATLLPINLDKSTRFSATLSYKMSLQKFDIYADMALVMPYSKYEFLGEERKSNFVSFDANVNMNYKITGNLGLFLTFNQQGHRTNGIVTQRSVTKLDFGFVGSFFKNRLDVNLAITDILQRANYNNVINQYNNMSYGTYGKNDFRGIELSVNYVIFNKNVNVNTSSRNTELSRVTQ